MQAHSRRTFLRQAGLGVAVAGAAVATPKLLSGDRREPAAGQAAAAPAALEGPLVAYLRDPANGEFSLLVGTREVSYTDRPLAARLARAAR